MRTVAVAIVCKTPLAGRSKTRLTPPLAPEECAEASACFIRDTAATIGALGGAARPVALYTPLGTEAQLRPLLPPGCALLPQREGDLGERLRHGVEDLLAAGHAGVVLLGSDSPTLPPAILAAAVAAVLDGDRMAISPARDGGYLLIGLSRPHPRLFEDIAWSTGTVFAETLDRAREIGLAPVVLPGWYDVDDAASFALLEAELDGRRPAFADPAWAPPDAPATRGFLARRRGGQAA